MRHLTSEQLIDLVEGARSESSTPHLRSCGACREKLAELRATLSGIAELNVPEPSPLFWDHFSARVHDAVKTERAAGSFPFGRWSWVRVTSLWAGTFAIVVLAVVIVTRGGRPEGPVSAPASSTAASGEAGSDAFGLGDDPSLSFVADLAADLDWDTATEAGLTTHVGIDDDAVTQLTESERRLLQQLLKREIARPGA